MHNGRVSVRLQRRFVMTATSDKDGPEVWSSVPLDDDGLRDMALEISDGIYPTRVPHDVHLWFRAYEITTGFRSGPVIMYDEEGVEVDGTVYYGTVTLVTPRGEFCT